VTSREARLEADSATSCCRQWVASHWPRYRKAAGGAKGSASFGLAVAKSIFVADDGQGREALYGHGPKARTTSISSS